MKLSGNNLIFTNQEAIHICLCYDHIQYPDREALKDFGNAVLELYREKREGLDEIQVANEPPQRQFIAKSILKNVPR